MELVLEAADGYWRKAPSVKRLVFKSVPDVARCDRWVLSGRAPATPGPTPRSVNFLFDRTQRPHLTGDDLSALTGVPKSTLANKAKLIRDVLRIGQMEPEFCRQESLASNPMAWMISVDGFIMDARTMPPEVQAAARRRGLIPDLPGRVGKDGGETTGGGERR